MKPLSWLISGALCGALLAGAASAFDLQKTTSGVPFVSGGIGADERAEMTAALPDYNLKIATAAKKSGAYLANVAAQVRDSKGNVVVDSVLEGPWFLTRLPAGTYEVRLTFRDQTQIKKIAVPTQGKRTEFFYWETPDIEELQASPEEREQAR